MAIENINVGALPNDGSGDAVRVAFGKVNNNFAEVGTLIDAAEAAAIPATEKGAASGVATLGTTRTLTAAQRPSAGLRLPGTAGNYASTPYKAALGITGDIDLRAFVGPFSTADQTLVGRRNDTANNQCYWLGASGGYLVLRWSPDGSGAALVTAGSTVAIARDRPLWYRATLDVNNGAGGYTVQFFTSEDGVAWTQLGATITGGSTTSIFAGASGVAALEVGSRNAGANSLLAADVFRAQVRSGIGGTLVADFNAESPPSRHGIHPSAFTDSVGNAWTINGSAWEYRDDLGRTLATAAEAAASTPGVTGGLALQDAWPLTAPIPRSQRWSVPLGIFSTKTITTADDDRLYSVFLENRRAVTLDRIGIEVVTGGPAGSIARLGIYRANLEAGVVHDLVLDAGTVAIDTSGGKEVTIDLTLPPGLYLLVCAPQVPSGSVTLRAVGGVSVPAVPGGALVVGMTNRVSYGGNNGSTNAASPLPDLTNTFSVLYFANESPTLYAAVRYA